MATLTLALEVVFAAGTWSSLWAYKASYIAVYTVGKEHQRQTILTVLFDTINSDMSNLANTPAR